MSKTMEEQTVNRDTTKQASQITREQLDPCLEQDAFPTRILPSCHTTSQKYKGSVDDDNCWGPQMPFAFDEDSMMDYDSKNEGEEHLE